MAAAVKCCISRGRRALEDEAAQERAMALEYASGDDIQLGDQVDYDGLRAELQLLADPEGPGAAERLARSAVRLWSHGR